MGTFTQDVSGEVRKQQLEDLDFTDQFKMGETNRVNILKNVLRALKKSSTIKEVLIVRRKWLQNKGQSFSRKDSYLRHTKGFFFFKSLIFFLILLRFSENFWCVLDCVEGRKEMSEGARDRERERPRHFLDVQHAAISSP